MKLGFHENHRLLFAVVFFGFIILTLGIAVGPADWVRDNTRPLAGSRPLTQQERRGLAIYLSEGCPYCHTQQVRPLDVDKPFGRPSAPGDYARLRPQDIWRMTPELLGTERTGPDLCDVGDRQPSATWNYIHLFNPRAVVKDSVMQAYPWLFAIKSDPGPDDIVVPVPPGYAPKKGKVVLTGKAADLVAYLLSLKQVPIPGSATPVSAEAGRPSSSRGASLFASRCAGCHGPDGEGIAGVFPPLKGDPVVNDRDPSAHIRTVLFGLRGKTINGTSYTAAMPAHASLMSDREIAAVINHERTSWGNSGPTVTVEDVERIREQGR
jgi:cytochrome c oxidase cbb3-type subunit II